MTEANARVICDSISEDGHRLVTVEATCWRPVLAEQNTHSVLARCSASSRARPLRRKVEPGKKPGKPGTLDLFNDDFAWPIVWPAEKKGMQGGKDLTGQDLADAQDLWAKLADFVGTSIGEYLDAHPEDESRLHKSMLNRWLEIGMWQTQIITATSWSGYFWQRCHKDAEPHIRAMAEAIRGAMDASTPTLVPEGGWHLPYWGENGGHESDWSDAEKLGNALEVAKMCSSARCARVSYLTQGGERDLSADVRLYGDLTSNRVGSEDPPHASPLAHVATPWSENAVMVDLPNGTQMGPLPKLGMHVGWYQLRHDVLGF